jgi:adenosine kinase
MRTLICGSIAFDNIMVFNGQFKEHILPESIHILNVAFLVPELRREFGGCAGNIAYNLKKIGGDPLIMATIGKDADAYVQRMDQLGLSRDAVRQLDDAMTAQAFITTDLDDNQITAFHPGAMNQSHLNQITPELGAGLAIVAPDGRDGMLQHAEQLAQHKIPFMFDPGQGLPMFSGEELLRFAKAASYIAVNDYEGKMLEEKTGQSLPKLAEQVNALIVTRGAVGSTIYAGGRQYDIPCVKASAIVDPTGCGDAYRAGLLYGIAHQWDWQACGQLASVLGSIKIASRGGQNHALSRELVAKIHREAFGSDPWQA